MDDIFDSAAKLVLYMLSITSGASIIIVFLLLIIIASLLLGVAKN